MVNRTEQLGNVQSEIALRILITPTSWPLRLRSSTTICAGIGYMSPTPRQNSPVTEIAHQTNQRPISANTVCCRLISNFTRRRPDRFSFLTNRLRQERLQWSTPHQHRRYQQWRTFLFWCERRYFISTIDTQWPIYFCVGVSSNIQFNFPKDGILFPWLMME